MKRGLTRLRSCSNAYYYYSLVRATNKSKRNGIVYNQCYSSSSKSNSDESPSNNNSDNSDHTSSTSMGSAVIGIDLGTTNSCVAVMEGTNPKVIENSDGVRTTPSVVAYAIDESGVKQKLVGQAAKRQAITNPESTFYSTKRLIGRNIDDPLVKKEQELVPFKITEGNAGQAWVEDKEGKKYAPQDIAGSILRKMKETAEEYLSKKIDKAVVTVPAYFNDPQRKATKLAGEIAGLKIDRIINEPTAAALAYGLNQNNNEIVAVYDLGGGTFDVSILACKDGVFEVKATTGDTYLGGQDFDNALINHLMSEFHSKKVNKGVDLKSDKFALQRIREAAEKAKNELSTSLQTDINLPFITAGVDGPKHLQSKITRSQFESMVSGLIQRTVAPTEQCIKDAGLQVSDIQNVLLVGGMTKMPKIQSTVSEIFAGKVPSRAINPDEAVAMGAAIQAGILSGSVGDVTIADVTPLTLSLQSYGGTCIPLIPKNTAIPAKVSEVFTTDKDGTKSLEIIMLQGESAKAAENKTLGHFQLTGIESQIRGMPQIEVTFEVDANGSVSITAKDINTKKEQTIKVEPKGGLTDEEVELMKAEADKDNSTPTPTPPTTPTGTTTTDTDNNKDKL